MRFVDEVIIEVVAGRGGNGLVAFRREAFVPRGGPSGGNGGAGGDVVLVASARHPTLLDVRHTALVKAENGRAGGPANRTGRRGRDRIVPVPPGTLVFDADTGELLADLVEPGARFVAARGGRGGRGNAAFATAVRRAPDFAEPGREGQRRRLRLELKLLADVGIVGMPNAGKSSLIRRISASRARVADYPFTTLVPNLGVVASGKLGSFVVADIPGLVAGAHEGVGLGDRFLRHVERTRVLVHVLSAAPDRDPRADHETVATELRRYSAHLAERPQLVLLNKIDLLPPDERDARIAALRRWATASGWRFAAASCLTGEGIGVFRRLLEEMVEAATPRPPARPWAPWPPQEEAAGTQEPGRK